MRNAFEGANKVAAHHCAVGVDSEVEVCERILLKWRAVEFGDDAVGREVVAALDGCQRDVGHRHGHCRHCLREFGVDDGDVGGFRVGKFHCYERAGVGIRVLSLGCGCRCRAVEYGAIACRCHVVGVVDCVGDARYDYVVDKH